MTSESDDADNGNYRIGQEVVFRVYKTPNSIACKMMDGRMLAEGLLSILQRRYFDSEEKAEQWAVNKADEIDVPVRLVRLGERVSDGGEVIAE